MALDKEERKRRNFKASSDESKRVKEGSSNENSLSSVLSGIFNILYKVSYLVGSEMFRLARHFWKRVEVLAARTYVLLLKWKRKAAKKLSAFAARIVRPVRQAKKAFGSFAASIKEAKGKGIQTGARIVLSGSRELLRGTGKLFHSIFNIAFPAAAICLLVMTVNYFNNLTFALSVEYGGEHIGYVKDESVFLTAENDMKSRIVNEESEEPIDLTAQFSISVVQKDELVDEEELADKIIQASGSVIEEAYGLYIDDNFIGASEEKYELLDALDSMLLPYRLENPDAKVEFAKKVEVREGFYPVSAIESMSSIEGELTEEEQIARIYTVEQGDSPILIAEKTDSSLSQLRLLNPGIDDSLLVGQEILLEQAVPFLGVKVTKTETYTEEIPFTVEQVSDSSMYENVTKIATEGKNGEMEVEDEVTYIDGVEVSRTTVRSEVISEPVTQVVNVGTKKPLQEISGTVSGTVPGFVWPVGGNGGAVSQYASRYHMAMDICGRIGMDIRASASGRVKLVRNLNTGYGKYIIIDHGGGVETLYAHNSQNLVSEGDYVTQGQVIALMGSTGNSTGPHCHFEIRLGGTQVNPYNYIGG